MQRIVLKRGKKQSQYRAEAAPHFLLLFLSVVVAAVCSIPFNMLFTFVVVLLIVCAIHSATLSHSLYLRLSLNTTKQGA